MQAFPCHIFTCYTLYSILVLTDYSSGTNTTVPSTVVTGLDLCTQAILDISTLFTISEYRMLDNSTSAGKYDCQDLKCSVPSFFLAGKNISACQQYILCQRIACFHG